MNQIERLSQSIKELDREIRKSNFGLLISFTLIILLCYQFSADLSAGWKIFHLILIFGDVFAICLFLNVRKFFKWHKKNILNEYSKLMTIIQ